jgi:hypothetical protein
MGNLILKLIGGFVISAFLLLGISSCNLFGENTGGYDCPPGGCVGEPTETEYEPIVP